MLSIRELYFYASPGWLGGTGNGGLGTGIPLCLRCQNGAGVVSVGSLGLFYFLKTGLNWAHRETVCEHHSLSLHSPLLSRSPSLSDAVEPVSLPRASRLARQKASPLGLSCY